MAPVLVFVVSDSLGDTAAAVTAAAVSQFPDGNVSTIRLNKVRSLEQVTNVVIPALESGATCCIFHTLVDDDLRAQLQCWAGECGVAQVDLIGGALDSLSLALGIQPSGVSGAIHEVDDDYFRRIEAMEFTVNHDDGRRTEELDLADIVLLGVSRTSKTPLSLVLAQRGYKVANVPLALGMKPPAEIETLDRRRVFGLVTSVSVLTEVRSQRLGKASGIAASYADPAMVQKDLDEARALMRRLGIIVLRTDNRAIEEVASEIEGRLAVYGFAR